MAKCVDCGEWSSSFEHCELAMQIELRDYRGKDMGTYIYAFPGSEVLMAPKLFIVVIW